jgi:hypothetical protein
MKTRMKIYLYIVISAVLLYSFTALLCEVITTHKQLESAEKTIEELSKELSEVNQDNLSLRHINSELEDSNEDFENQILRQHQVESLELSDEIIEVDYVVEETTPTYLSKDSGFRSWMPYTAITQTSSLQYKVVRLATPDSNGLLKIDDKVVVALGTGWSLNVGDTAKVVTEFGEFDIVVGDIKADCHTDSANKVTLHNGCVVEFIVDQSTLDSQIKVSGNVASLDQYRGRVLSIEKTGCLL